VDVRGLMITALIDRYRCPDDLLEFDLSGPLSFDTGYFRFGRDRTCYGRSASGYRTSGARSLLYDVAQDMTAQGASVFLPFNPTEVIDNLRLERYAKHLVCSDLNRWRRSLRDLYYFVRPLLRLSVRKHIQRAYLRGWQKIAFPRWPVDTTVEDLSEELLLRSMKAKGIDRLPFVWFWPKAARGCVVMTHDVEAEKGYNLCGELMNMDDSFGFKASFQLVPEGSYKVSSALLQEMRSRGFEINIHDLNHDGQFYRDRKEFLRRVEKINQYGQSYGARGFRAAVLYRNLTWYDALDFSFDMSVPNVGHLDPQRGGCCTVMPYFVGDILEVPTTTTQDYMLFHLLHDYSLDLWKAQTETILSKNGLVSFLVHPDYVMEKKACDVYADLLSFLRHLGSRDQLWFALPGEVDQWWRARSKMRVVHRGEQWRIEGPETERAVLAFARFAGDRLEYEVDPQLRVAHGHNGGHALREANHLQ
jgi:hypothetical protein